MEVKIKKLHKDAVIPQYSKIGDVGMDLTAVSVKLQSNEVAGRMMLATLDYGVAIEIPEGYFGLIVPRSSNYKRNGIMSNSVGIIDSGYRGPLKSIFYIPNTYATFYDVKERVAQLIILPYPQIKFVESEELSETERGEGGFGSTGNK